MDEETRAALVSITEQRSATYGLLSRLYRVEVDEEFLKEMKGMRFPAATGNSQVDEGYRLIATFLSNTWGNTITDLAIDYVRTFIGHGVDAFSAAYPYESVYTSEKRLMMQDARDEVLAIYRSQGLDKQETWKEAEDHLALELEFMQILANRTVDALKAGDEDEAIELLTTQKNFLEDHLMAWVPMMTSDMRRFAKTDLYRGLAYLTDGFMTVDFEFLQDLLQA
ncbi:MAG: molecular chaperone TorD family protein [Eggerthellaceae bacterium]|nr:molecular chaperone TorD family protein [Eggerthellaceae bacterium]